MCGISAVVSLSPKPLDPSVTSTKLDNDVCSSAHSKLDKSLDVIKHRGPDARNIWTSNDDRVGVSQSHRTAPEVVPFANRSTQL
jgi:asparagine synthase (glutamine-hydrolysing)